MGQRLVIINYYAEYPRDSIYFHWSGYTDRAIFELKEFRNYIQENLDKIKDVETFTNYCKQYETIRACAVHTTQDGIGEHEAIAEATIPVYWDDDFRNATYTLWDTVMCQNADEWLLDHPDEVLPTPRDILLQSLLLEDIEWCESDLPSIWCDKDEHLVYEKIVQLLHFAQLYDIIELRTYNPRTVQKWVRIPLWN